MNKEGVVNGVARNTSIWGGFLFLFGFILTGDSRNLIVIAAFMIMLIASEFDMRKMEEKNESNINRTTR